MELCESDALHSLIKPAVAVNKCVKLKFLMIFLATFADEHKGLAIMYLVKMATHRAYSEIT